MHQRLQIDWIYCALEGGTILIECSSKLKRVCCSAKMAVCVISGSSCGSVADATSIISPILNLITDSSKTIVVWWYDRGRIGPRRKDKITVSMDIQEYTHCGVLHICNLTRIERIQFLLCRREDGFGILNYCFNFRFATCRCSVISLRALVIRRACKITPLEWKIAIQVHSKCSGRACT
jgi:hypothetical protein